MANAAPKTVVVPNDFDSDGFKYDKLKALVKEIGGKGNLSKAHACAGILALFAGREPEDRTFWPKAGPPNPVPIVEIPGRDPPPPPVPKSDVKFSVNPRSTLAEMRSFVADAGLKITGASTMKKEPLWVALVLEWHRQHPDGGQLDDSGNASFVEEGSERSDEMLEQLGAARMPALLAADKMLASYSGGSTRYVDFSRMEGPAPSRPEHVDRRRIELTSEAILRANSDHTPRVGLETIELVGAEESIDNVLIALRAWPAGNSPVDEDERGKRLTESVLPVFVPSKGRAGQLPLLWQCNEEAKHELAKLPVVVAVGPDDLDDYAAAYPHLVFALLPWDVGGIGYSREVLRSIAAGQFKMSDGKPFDGDGSPVHMLDDNIVFKVNSPLVVGKFAQDAKKLLYAGLGEPLLFAQQAAHKAGMRKAGTDWALVGFEEIGSDHGNDSAPVFGTEQTISCYKAVLIHAPLAEARGVRYVPGVRWPEDIAFNFALARNKLRLLKTRWPYRFEKLGGGGGGVGGNSKPRFTVASLLAPWRDVQTLRPEEKRVLAAILKRSFKKRDEKLSGKDDLSIAPKFALFELDWRKAAVDEGSLSVDDVAPGPVDKLIHRLNNVAALGERWKALLDTIVQAAAEPPGFGDPAFVAECLMSCSDALVRGLAAGTKSEAALEKELLDICKAKLSYK